MRWVALMFVVSAWAAGGQVVAGNEEIHRLIGEKNYSQALQKITAGLALKGPAAKAVSRYDLYLLKGECHLQTKATGLAADAYANAAKEAPDARSKAIAAAHEALARQTRGTAYTPKPAPGKPRPTPIDVLDKESRKRAFGALLAEELAANAAKLTAAKSSKGLGAIAVLFKPLVTMTGLELASTGEARQVDALRGELVEQVKRAVAEALRGVSREVGQIDKEANTFVETYQDKFAPSASGYTRIVREKVYKKKGLSDEQAKHLQQANATCDKISPAMAEMAEGLGAPEKAFDSFVDEAGRIRKEVDRLLDTDYQRVYREIPK